MYRLLWTKGVTLNNVRLIVSRDQCPQHNFYLNSQKILLSPLKSNLFPFPDSFRYQSSGPVSPAENVPKKRKRFLKPRYSKYVELLEITNDSTKQKKTRVKHLKAKQLQEFISKTQLQILAKRAKEQEKLSKSDRLQNAINSKKLEMELDQTSGTIYDEKPILFMENKSISQKLITNPSDVNKILKSFNNFREVIDTIEHGDPETLSGLIEIENSEAKLEESEADMALGNISEEGLVDLEKALNPTEKRKSRKENYKSKTHNSAELERTSKEKGLSVNLSTYLSVCVSANMVTRGLSTLISYRQRIKNQSKDMNFITIEMYNILLGGFASTGEYNKCQVIIKCCGEDGIALNHQSFAALLECLGRLEPTNENTKLISNVLERAESLGITANMIMDKSKFHSDQREMVLDTIKRIKPDFLPTYTPPNLFYKNNLLNSLNKYVKDADDVTPATFGTEIMRSKHGFSKDQLEQLSREQLRIELKGSITVESIENTKEYENSELCRQKYDEIQSLWKTQIITAINRDLNTLRAQTRFKPQGYMTYYVYLKTLDPSEYADIVLREIRTLAEGSETYSPTVGQLYRELGKKVQNRFLVEQKKQNGVLNKTGEIYSDYCDKWVDGRSSDNPRQMWQRLVHLNRTAGPSMDISEPVWPYNVLLGVGRFLYNIIMRDIRIDSNIMKPKTKTKSGKNLLPAFYTLFRSHGKLVKEEVKPHPVLARLLRASRQRTLTFESNMVPMLCPPQPWSTPVNGGYLLNRSELIRLPHQAVQQWARINEGSPEAVYPPLDSLNQLSSIPWRVNTDILDVIISVFQKGGDDKLDVPQSPNTLPPLPSIPAADPSITNAERAQLFKDKMNHRRKQAEMYSLWCDTLYRLSLANHYRDKTFWLPHNMDFRGRVYPIPPHLNHLGSDLARSILIFDKAQPLGVDGFSWLKLHCINLTGAKKRDSVRERLLYAEEVMDDILDSADNPLNGRQWWLKSDEPWQTLSCCIEIAKVHRSKNPAKYMSRFPIHQDGSCNGLQHYAALGRDQAGAISVNLSPASIPQDVYSAVAALVEKTREMDSQNGLEVAKVLSGYVKRKVIKQTVMTTVYGVTRYGARLQIAKQLKDIDAFPKDWVWPASTYLTSKTFESLREMFTSTREIQDWFTECARLISGVCTKNVEWVTPLGLPVVQPYNKMEQKSSGSNRSSHRITESMSMDMYEKPNVMKQKNAFPPNFIHSLDSSHMMLTSLHCERKGITFVSVHDCFWTHACTVPDMNKLCREEFVALHSQPILEDLSQFMLQKYSFQKCDLNNKGTIEDLSKHKLNSVLQSLPGKGNFDLDNVLKSIYFFS